MCYGPFFILHTLVLALFVIRVLVTLIAFIDHPVGFFHHSQVTFSNRSKGGVMTNTFTAKVDHSRFNDSCLRLSASTLVDLIFQSRSFSLGGKLVQQLQYI
jgi:hypothetical protein